MVTESLPVATMLCDLCQTIKFPWPVPVTPEQEACFIHPEDRKIFFTHYSSVQEIVDSAKGGCHLCSQLAHGLTSSFRFPPAEKDYQDVLGPIRLVYSNPPDDDPEGRPKAFQVVLDGDRDAVGSLTFDELLSGVKLPEGKLLSMTGQWLDIVHFKDDLSGILKDKITGECITGSRENLLLAKEWLRECFEGPHWCKFNLREIPQLPTRVIDVGPPDGSRQPVLRETNGEKGHYIALSHCWGSTKIITTTSTTLPERINGIPFDSLSKTFQDAVLVTRGLGWSSLWIDSLCILQDSSDDWEIESAKMGQYYTNSLVTIAAVSAKGGEEGCFRDRNMLQITPCPVPKQADIPGGLNAGEWFIRPTWQPDQGENSTERSRGAPLDSRAWAFQERIMSPRVLQFEEHQMSFICYDGGASEQYPEGFPEQRFFMTSPFENVRKKFGSFQALMALDGDVISVEETEAENVEKKRDIWQYWRHLSCTYSSRSITYRTDALPALSGLASQIALIARGTYLVGLWKEDIHRELLWTKEGTPATPHLDRVPPSWSWTSTQREGPDKQGYMTFPLDNEAILDPDIIWDETCFLLLEARITLPGKNPFGKPSEGVLHVSSFLKQVTHYTTPWRPDWGGAQKFNLIDKDEFVGRYLPDNPSDEDAKYGSDTMIWCCPVMTKNGPIPRKPSDVIGSPINSRRALPKVGEADEWLEIIRYFQDEEYYSKATIRPSGDDYVEAENKFREYDSSSNKELEEMVKVAGLALAPSSARPGEMVRIGIVDIVGGWFDDCERVEFTII